MCDEIEPIHKVTIQITDDDVDTINVYTYDFKAENSLQIFTV